VTLVERFGHVRPSIVAFIWTLAVLESREEQRPKSPAIIGAGFLVDPRRVVATNRHVVET
jgi:S1-C subfamily serine protease